MKILAFDTSTTACSVALSVGDKIKVLHNIAPMQQASLILPMIHELLTSFSLTVNDLDAIAYGCGPGSFTGIRIASCVAQGIAFAKELPIIRISSLAAIAHAAFLEQQWNKLLVAVDARTEQVYWGIYEYNHHGNMSLIDKEQVCVPKEVTIPSGFEWCGVGDGWYKYQSSLITRLGFEPKQVNASQLPTAQALLELAKIKYRESDWVSITDALPHYLR